MAIDPSMAIGGADWMIPSGVGSLGAPTPDIPAAGSGSGSGSGFGAALAHEIQSLETSQTAAAEAARGVATGTIGPEDAVMAMERARLGMQLAATVRTKAVDAIQTIFHTQI